MENKLGVKVVSEEYRPAGQSLLANGSLVEYCFQVDGDQLSVSAVTKAELALKTALSATEYKMFMKFLTSAIERQCNWMTTQIASRANEAVADFTQQLHDTTEELVRVKNQLKAVALNSELPE
jgi:hypothetical protein